MKQVSTKELRDFLLKYLKEERKLSTRSINYYNSIIRFIYDVVLDYPINQKQKVTFKYRDYKDKNKIKEMTIEAEEFIRRFLLHILPPRFMKIRHYGLLGNRNKKTKLAECKKLTNTANLEKLEISTLEILKKTLGVDFNLCPICKKGHLVNPNSS